MPKHKPKSPPERRLNSLQYLRSFCALCVVAFHAEGGINKYWPGSNGWSLIEWGHYGVPAFFCLSGFVISYSAFARQKNPLNFIWSRAIRIYPAYLVIGSIYALMLYTLPQGALANTFTLSIDSISKFFLFNLGRPGGLVYVGWTLFYEMCFYLLFSLLVKDFRKTSQTTLYTVALSILLIATSASGLSRINNFLGGMAIFTYLSSRNSASRIAVITAALACFLSTPETPIICAIILIITGIEKIIPSLFMSEKILTTGDSSYSIYLCQILTIGACLRLSSLAASKFPHILGLYSLYYILTMITSLTSTIAIGVLMRRFLEKPAYRILNPSFLERESASED